MRRIISFLCGSFLPLLGQEISVGEGLDSPGLSWETAEGEGEFFGEVDAESIDGDRAVAVVDFGEKAVLSTVLPGPGVIDFWLNGGKSNGWRAYLNDEELDLSSRSWPFGFRVEGDGPHTFRIEHLSTEPEVQTLTVDGAIFRPDRKEALNEGIDYEGALSFSGHWRGTPWFSQDGNDAVTSGLLEPGESAIVHAVVEGPIEVSYWSRAISRHVEAEFYLNGTKIDSSQGGSRFRETWEKTTFVVPEGEHTLRWEATGRESTAQVSPADGLWLDGLTVRPLSESLLSRFGEVPSNFFFSGPLEAFADGVDENGSIGISVGICQHRFRWPVPASNQPRRVSFFAKSGGGSLSFLHNSVGFQAGDEWEKVTLLIAPGEGSLVFQADSFQRLALLDQLEIEELSVDGPESALGAVAESFTFEEWFVFPGVDEVPRDAVVSLQGSGPITGEVTGPAWLSYEAITSGNRSLDLIVDGQLVISTSQETSPFVRFPIPSGTHSVRMVHSQASPFATNDSAKWIGLRDLQIEKIETVPIETFSRDSDLVFETSGERIQDNTGPAGEVLTPGFFATRDGEVHATGIPGQRLTLSTEVAGPAVVCFDRQIGFFPDPHSDRATISHGGSCTTGTVFIVIGEPPSFVTDWGTRLEVNGVSSFTEGAAGWFIPVGPPGTEAVEPFNSTSPLWNAHTSGAIEVGKMTRDVETGWTSHRIYLGEGNHTLTWKLATASNDNDYGYYAQWKHLKLANLKVTKIRGDYARWASTQWRADAEVTDQAAKLAPWHDPSADPDRDGSSNGIEFAYGSDPRSSESFPPPPQLMGGSQPLVVWPLPDSSVGKGLLRVLFSENLRDWSGEGVRSERTDGGLEAWVEAPGSRAFFRLAVDLVEDPE